MTENQNVASPMIRLEHLTKSYPRQVEPSVDNLSLDVPRGEIVILVGPSGCGKTTTMKMINRIIEPTSGRIILDGEDVTSTDPNILRRGIGYVIQKVGLFPHMTIGENVATVPKLLKWDRARIDERVDELLEIVNMPAARYRNRYPKELSGGQLQRIGVARALCADPEVMLMDEPFGAIDPITRSRLQNEFLRLQEHVRKTIVFVTHDIDEAIKMGDRIAVLDEHSHVAQYGPPEEILTAPANDFVAGFVGSGASLKRLTLTTVSDVPVNRSITTSAASIDAIRNRLRADHATWGLSISADGRPQRWIAADSGSTFPTQTVDESASLMEALDALVTSPAGMVAVVDERGAYRGALDFAAISTVTRNTEPQELTDVAR
ncbi:ABC transporter ATP-binding protein [Microbacterium soli]|uniref:Betaine/proline/choline family ABC transporter ATP-binding protein n=1 Tax=Microbacterium soli TaxID=446075 RepID=A0ABP7N7A2_9MICO